MCTDSCRSGASAAVMTKGVRSGVAAPGVGFLHPSLVFPQGANVGADVILFSRFGSHVQMLRQLDGHIPSLLALRHIASCANSVIEFNLQKNLADFAQRNA